MFYAQILALVIYVVFSKLLMHLKFKKEIDQEDPFLTLLRSSEDFLGNDNYILMCVTLQVINIELLIFSAFNLLNDEWE